MEDAPVTVRGRCGEGETESSVPGLEVVVTGESGRNELLTGTVCTLWSAQRNAKLEKHIWNH